MIAFGMPWTALGPKSLWSDSGFLLVYELFKKMHELFGTVSLICLDPRFRDVFESSNKSTESGVWAVYNEVDRVPGRQYENMFGARISNAYLATANICPTDFAFTMMRHIIPYLSLVCDDRFTRYRIPVYLQPTMSGREGEKKIIPNYWDFRLQMEASSYMTASRTFWVTEEQRSRGYAICKRFLSSTVFREIQKRHKIIGGGITELVKTAAYSDSEVCKRLQRSNKDFKVSFVGRFTSNKNPQFLFDSMRTLFAKHNLQMNVVSVGDIALPDSGYKKIKNNKDAMSIIGSQDHGGKKGREYYAQTILPSLDCGVNATITEAHPSIPREGIYVGIPWLLPDRPWSRAMFKDVYPFYYRNDAEFIALIQKLRKGKISKGECDRFNQCRHDRSMIEFMEDTATKVHECALIDSEEASTFFKKQSFDRLEEAFNAHIKKGSTFVWSEMLKYMNNTAKLCVTHRPQQRSPYDFYAFIKPRIKCIDPKLGRFERIS